MEAAQPVHYLFRGLIDPFDKLISPYCVVADALDPSGMKKIITVRGNKSYLEKILLNKPGEPAKPIRCTWRYNCDRVINDYPQEYCCREGSYALRVCDFDVDRLSLYFINKYGGLPHVLTY